MRNDVDLNSLLHQGPQVVKAQMDRWLREGKGAKEGVHWFALGEFAADESRYLDDPCQDDGMLWSEISLTAYEQALKVDGSKGRTSYENSMMLLRAYMITHCGIVPRHRVLDPQIIQRWFFECLPMTRSEATEKSRHWRDLPLEQVQLLRDIKHRLRVIQKLLDHGILTEDLELIEWAHIRDDLP